MTVDARIGTGDAESPSGFRHAPALQFIVAIAVCAILGMVFHQSQLAGGETWDEAIDLQGTAQQLDLAKRWIAGEDNIHFSNVVTRGGASAAFYGIVAVLPAHLAKSLASTLGPQEVHRIASYTLHATAFACYLLTLLLTYFILIRVTSNLLVAAVGVILLALYPFWLGQSFFNHKDVPTAAFATMALYAATGLLQASGRRHLIKFTALLALATILIAGLKIAALALIVPSWIAAFWALMRGRQFGILTMLPVVAAIGILAVTPVAWTDPLNFFVGAIRQMLYHPWNSCTLTAGSCILVHSREWSAQQYLLTWFLVQTPLLIGIGAIVAILLAPFRGAVAMTIAASAVMPFIIIVAANSVLYSGLRQVLFAIPLIFILGAMFWNEIGSRAGYGMVGLFAAAQMALFIWDNVAMFPYNYVYFNLPSRQIADSDNFITDYWGFSFREAAKLSAVTQSGEPIVLAHPIHLVEPFLPAGKQALDMLRDNQLPRSMNYIAVGYHWPPLPKGCAPPEYVVRQLPLGGRPLLMSYAARCVVQ